MSNFSAKSGRCHNLPQYLRDLPAPAPQRCGAVEKQCWFCPSYVETIPPVIDKPMQMLVGTCIGDANTRSPQRRVRLGGSMKLAGVHVKAPVPNREADFISSWVV